MGTAFNRCLGIVIMSRTEYSGVVVVKFDIRVDVGKRRQIAVLGQVLQLVSQSD